MDHTSIKQPTHSGECHQLAMSDNHRITPVGRNPSEYVVNINKLDKINFTKLKTSVTRVTI